MKQPVVFCAALLSGLALIVTTSRQALSQIQVLPAFVRLQATTPGTPQAGHSNITGTAIAGQFQGGGASLTNVNANLLDGIDSSAFLQSIPVPLTLSGSSPTQILRVENLAAAGVDYGVYSTSASTNGTGVAGIASASSGLAWGMAGYTNSPGGAGVYARSNSATSGSAVFAEHFGDSGIGVYGVTYATTGPTVGVQGDSASPGGTGVLGRATSPTGAAVLGVHGISSSNNGRGVMGESPKFGVYGVSTASGGVGTFGIATAFTGNSWGLTGYSNSEGGGGVYATNTSDGGYGVLSEINGFAGTALAAVNFSTSGSTTGILGSVASSSGTAVLGQATASSGPSYAGKFTNNSSQGYAGYFLGVGPDVVTVQNTGLGRGMLVQTASDTAIWAIATSAFAGIDGRNGNPSGFGIFGYATSSTGTNYGSVGQTASPSGYGVFSFGNFGASGTKAFRIDHPLDPENKYLLHYSAEGPEPQDFYNGTVRTGSKGEAWVQLPDYFEEINKDFRYTLTVVDDTDSAVFVQAKVAKKIAGNRFKIRTSAPYTEVCWRVDAVRNDRWVRKYGSATEVQKEGRERGTYQNPELYGKPERMGLSFRGPVSKLSPP